MRYKTLKKMKKRSNLSLQILQDSNGRNEASLVNVYGNFNTKRQGYQEEVGEE